MSKPAPVTLLLTLDPAAEPITGHAVIGNEDSPFSGWLELIEAIETGLGRARAGSAAPGTDNGVSSGG